MKEVLMFHLDSCGYCDKARRALEAGANYITVLGVTDDLTIGAGSRDYVGPLFGNGRSRALGSCAFARDGCAAIR